MKNGMSIIGICSRSHRCLNLICMLVASFIWQASNHPKSLSLCEWLGMGLSALG